MAAKRSITVIGASLAGIRTAQGLRERGFDGDLVLIGGEEHPPYDRPPLSKGLLAGDVGPADIMVLPGDELAGLDIDVRLGCWARALDPVRRHVRLDDDTEVRYDQLVIATGAAPRMPTGWQRFEGVHLLRTLNDGLALRAELGRAPRVVVVGGGFIGCEVAASARKLGLEVSLVEPLAAPMARVLGSELATVCAEIHRDAGVRLYCGRAVESLEGKGRVERVRLADGVTIDADLVVVGIGARPQTDWLAGSGVAVADGVVCDASCATSVPGVFAAGDVAHWFNPLFGQGMRVEHWTNACEQARFVAGAILGDPKTQQFSSVPYVWSEQHGVKIEIAGVPRPTDHFRIVDGSVRDRKFLAQFERDGNLTGALAINATRGVLGIRRLLADPAKHRLAGAAT